MTKQKKVWLLAQCLVTKGMLEVAQSAFAECDALGMDIDDGITPESLEKYRDDSIFIKAYFTPDVSKDTIKTSLEHVFAAFSLIAPTVEFSLLEEEDWQGNFVRSCRTFKVEPNIYIVPSFEIEEFKKNHHEKLFIEMDPENAFGTGQHQTTKLCLTSIYEILSTKEKNQLTRLTCLDVGTGSGILAILMKKMDANLMEASEIDEDALMTAKKNAQKNDVEINMLLVDEFHSYEKNYYHLVVANILAPVLIKMRDNLAYCLKRSGQLILSGILVNQANEVTSSYERYGLTFKKKQIMDDWCALVFKKE
jgi:ribosomal protein L11 methyltransferase